jgi:hypothetical protein
MNARHAAALALVGWYVMSPPIVNGHVQASAPVEQWNAVYSVQSARDCKSRLNSLHANLPKLAANIASGHSQLPALSAGDRARLLQKINALALSQCIAEDDPRLKSK